MVHVVAYDLTSPNDTGADYERVIGAIKKQYPTWVHLEQSVWLVETTQDAGEVRETLKPFLNAKDVLFVSRLSGNWATWNAGVERNNWLRARTF
ncbi:MAG TPA: hypothetical protein VGU66_08925 [Candidatus Elarobacter sp.]|nr:hypothetical protein [Candidatus Elarobacter sp.]